MVEYCPRVFEVVGDVCVRLVRFAVVRCYSCFALCFIGPSYFDGDHVGESGGCFAVFVFAYLLVAVGLDLSDGCQAVFVFVYGDASACSSVFVSACGPYVCDWCVVLDLGLVGVFEPCFCQNVDVRVVAVFCFGVYPVD